MYSNIPLLAIDTAHACAWRALYVAVRHTDPDGSQYRHQIAHLGIDPGDGGIGGKIFGGAYWHRHGFSFRVTVPFSVWRFNRSPLRAWMHRHVRDWLHGIDGRRYGRTVQS